MALENKKYRQDIDGLRAFAILSVVFFHFFPTIFPGGFIGVDIFFVISGYLITKNIYIRPLTDAASVAYFFYRRITRILPSLLVVVLTGLILCFYFSPPEDFINFAKDSITSIIFLSNFSYQNSFDYFNSAPETRPLLHTWSLSVEFQFYCLFPALVYIQKLKKIDLSSIFLLIILGFLSNLYIFNISLSFYSPFSRLWEFSFGAIAFLMRQRFCCNIGADESLLRSLQLRKSIANELMMLLSTLVIILFILIAHGKNPNTQYFLIIPVFATCVLIYYGSNTLFSKWIFSNPILVGIGKISYPIYLWHWLFLSLWIVFFQPLNIYRGFLKAR